MPHSKFNNRGFSLYLNNWNRSTKKYINVCCLCGRQGYSPAILAADFYNRDADTYSEKRAIYEELTRTLNPLPLDDLGRCEICRGLSDAFR